MERKSINRFYSFCRSLENLKKSITADPTADFVLEGTVQNYNLTFDLSWKIMKDILVKELEILDYSLGSPRENLKTAFSNGLINDDIWMQMLRTRNLLAHDYDGTLAGKEFRFITTTYYQAFKELKDTISNYYESKE